VQNDNETLDNAINLVERLTRAIYQEGAYSVAAARRELDDFLRKHLKPDSTQEPEPQHKGVLQGLGNINLEQKPSGKRFEYIIIFNDDINEFASDIELQLNLGLEFAGKQYVSKGVHYQPMIRITDEANDE
jgi:hypothetical protein